jgi:hypothetical protein
MMMGTYDGDNDSHLEREGLMLDPDISDCIYLNLLLLANNF